MTHHALYAPVPVMQQWNPDREVEYVHYAPLSQQLKETAILSSIFTDDCYASSGDPIRHPRINDQWLMY